MTKEKREVGGAESGCRSEIGQPRYEDAKTNKRKVGVHEEWKEIEGSQGEWMRLYKEI